MAAARVRRNLLVGAAVAAVGLAAVACGTQVSPQVRERAAAGLLGGPDAGAGVSGGAAAGTGSGPAGGAATAVGVGGAGSVSGAAGGGGASSGGGGTGSGAGGAAQAGGGAAGGSGGGCSAGAGSDVGLSPSAVTVGTIASLTGPVPGLFEGAVEGTQAFAAYLNATGGICGRQLKVSTADDGTDCGQNQADTENLLPHVFAFVGSFSLYDGCGAKILAQHKDVADVHRELDQAAGALSNHFSPAPGPPGYATGMFAYYARTLGEKVRHAGTIGENIPSAALSQQWITDAAKSAGWTFVYSRNAAATETDFTSDFVKMCHQQHVEVFFVLAQTAKNAATMLQDEQKAGCPPLVNVMPIAYDQSFVGYVGDQSAAEGVLGWNEYALFLNADEAARVPEVGLFQRWFRQVYPDKSLNLFAMYSWADGRLFEQAMRTLGPRPTRAALTAALARIHRFDANGLVAPIDPTSKTTGPTCYVLWRIHNGGFERVDTPADGYRCDGGFHRDGS